MITDTEARNIASQWHGGGGTALYAFASTGAINTARADHDIVKELYECLETTYTAGVENEINSLLEYALEHKPRAAVAGWSALPLDPSPQEQSR